MAIFDNEDDLSLVEAFLPPGGEGHLLLTTRAQTPGTLANGITVEEMDLQEGMLLLLRRARVLAPDAPLDQASATDRIVAETITREMDGLPLALDQAGAYIEETHCSLLSYQEQHRHQQSRLLHQRGGTGKDHPEPVATTWSLSFAQVDHLNATAADLVRCCAFLAPDAIPEQLLVEGASELGPHLRAIATDVSHFDEAMGILLRYSLVQRKREDYSMKSAITYMTVPSMPKPSRSCSVHSLFTRRPLDLTILVRKPSRRTMPSSWKRSNGRRDNRINSLKEARR